MNLTTLDFISLGLIVGAGLIGYYKGAVNTLISLLGMIASFIIARFFSVPITNWLLTLEPVRQFVDNTIIANVLSAISSYGTEGLQNLQSSLGLEGLVINTAEVFQSGGTAAADAVNIALQPIIYQVVSIVVFLVLLLMCNVVVGIVRKMGRGINHVPIIGIANRITGLGLGAIIGFVVACIVIACVLYYGIFTAKIEVVQLVKEGVLTGPIALYLH